MSFLKKKSWTRKTTLLYFELTCHWCNSSGSRSKCAGHRLAYETKEVKQLAVSYDQGKTLLSLLRYCKDKTYPFLTFV
jgi:hypothetical protein